MLSLERFWSLITLCDIDVVFCCFKYAAPTLFSRSVYKSSSSKTNNQIADFYSICKCTEKNYETAIMYFYM